MSYVLMVGAVVEGLLFNQFGDKKLFKLITCAVDANIINHVELPLFEDLRKSRNRIHPWKYNEPFADRKMAMGLSITFEHLLKRQW